MKRWLAVVAVAAIALAAVGTVSANGDSDRHQFKASLKGAAESPPISTVGSGSLKLRINDSTTQITYELTYGGLEGGAVSTADLRFAQPTVIGGTLAFLCGGTKSACPASGTVTGTIVAADIQALTAQGIAGPADWSEVLRAIRRGLTYANVHTGSYPNGEIRGQLKAHGHHD